jgi:ribosomal protein L30/L7E
MNKIVIVRVRGKFHLDEGMKSTFSMLGLPRKNSAVIKDATPSILGMVHKVKDFVTWGTCDAEIEKMLEPRKKNDNYTLHPPRKGYGPKGTKVAFKVGGSLGDRKDKIKELLVRML